MTDTVNKLSFELMFSVYSVPPFLSPLPTCSVLCPVLFLFSLSLSLSTVYAPDVELI